MKRGVGEQVGHTTIVVVLFFASILTIYPFWHVLMYSLSDSAKAMEGAYFFGQKDSDWGNIKYCLAQEMHLFRCAIACCVFALAFLSI